MTRRPASPGRSPRPRGRSLADRFCGLLALLVIAALLVGIPVALWALRGNPLPDTGTDLPALLDRISAPDEDGSLFLAALTWLGWLAWASFALAVLLETLGQLRGLPTPHLPALGPQQRAASVLVAAAAVLFTAPLLPPAPALAATDAPSPAPPASSLSTPVSTQAAGPVGTPEQAGARPSVATPARTYTVRPGDTLWQIATDQLGDGTRYTEIARLNYGVRQADGHALTDSHWLTPGWQLTLPAAGSAAAPAGPVRAGEQAVTVQPGDTLWQIAQEHLGDGLRYSEIAAASTGRQDDGARLTDPDLIRPGWTLTLPSTTASPAPPPATPRQPPVAPPDQPDPPAPRDTAPAPPAAPRPSASAPAPAPSVPAQGEHPSSPEAHTAEPDRDLGTVRTVGGVGALMAAGLLALLGVKRTRQQRRRRPGQRIAMPPPQSQPAEDELRRVEDPDGLARIDQALRSLSVLLADTARPLPTLRMARLVDADLELYLDDPTTPVAPFLATSTPTIWTLPADAPLLPAEDLEQVAAPFPSLITIGHDLDGAHVLLDLEHTTHLAIHGNEDASFAVLAALATELATSRWADDLQVTLIGCLPQLPQALGTGRVRHVDTLADVLPALEHRAATIRQVMAASGLPDLQHARSAGNQRPHAGAWYPEILLIGGPIDPTDRQRLQDLLRDTPRVSLAAVTATDPPPAEWTLTLSASDDGPGSVAVLQPLNVGLRPQQLRADDLDQLLELLAVADLPAQDPPLHPSAPRLIIDEPSLADLGRVITPTSIHLARAPSPPTPLVDAENVRTDQGSAGEDSDQPAATPAPLVRVLGPVTVLHARGELEGARRHQLTEIAAYLALHPGLDHNHLDEAKWPGARNVSNTRNSAVSKLRRWLGTAPDGSDYLPEASSGYRLHPSVRSDWDLWHELLPDGPAAASTTELAAALELVKGQPFAGVSKRTYAWAERDKQEMISAINDVAHELAQRCLANGDAILARRAAAAGLQADPGAELLWRDLMRAEWVAGDISSLNNTADRLIELTSQLGDELEPETEALLDEVLSRSTPQAGAR